MPTIAAYARADVTRSARSSPTFARGLDAVCHIAGQVSIIRSFSDPVADLRTNVEGTLNILQLCLKYRVPRLLYASSMTLYGDSQTVPTSETEPCLPDSYYGITKYAAERYVPRDRAERPDLGFDIPRDIAADVQRVRSGPGRSTILIRACFGIFLGNLMRGEPIRIFGDGEQTRDFVYIDDIVDGWARALTTDAANGAIINLGSGRSLSINQLAARAIAAFGHTPGGYEIIRASARPGSSARSEPTSQRHVRSWAWEPRTTFDAGLAKTVRWARAEFAAMPAAAQA